MDESAATRPDLRRDALRRALLITALSLVAWLTWNGLRTFKHPWGDLSGGTYTDHLSHMNAARAFPRVGIDIWRKPAIELSRAPSAAERAAWPADVHPGGSWRGGATVVDGWPADKPWVTSWGQIPRLYPPGDMLLVAPVAWLYHQTNLTLTEANRWLFALFLIYAHLGVFFIVRGLLEENPRSMPLLDIAALATYIYALFWTMQGFYDAAAIAPLLLCARCLRERRGLAAGVAYCVAAFLHFRALFLAPWAIYAAWIFIHDRQWRDLRARDLLALFLGLFCAAASLTALKLVSPTLAQQEINNSVNLSIASHHVGALMLFALVVSIAACALSYARAWFDLATLAWLTMMMLMVKEAHEWHVVILLAWLVAPVLMVREKRAELVRAARLVSLVYLAFMVMVN